MSTRGSVAWKDANGKWVGVYNHSDSYPTCLGSSVFDTVKRLGAANTLKRLQSVGDWREFESGGVCKYCGKVAGQPHSISGDIYIRAIEEKGFPDPEAKKHQHSAGAKEQFDPRKDPLFLEWVYIILADGKIEVWKSVDHKDRNPALPCTGKKRPGYPGGPSYTHVHVGTWDTTAPSLPDFQAEEEKGEVMRYAPDKR